MSQIRGPTPLCSTNQHRNMSRQAVGHSGVMLSEASECATIVAKQLQTNRDRVKDIAMRLRSQRPVFVSTFARGSSSCAATYARYMIETHIGIPVSPAALSVHSLYRSTLNLSGSVGLCISQSGSSPDLIATASAIRRAGAIQISCINAVDSPLEALADHFIPLWAGIERSVAATKSFVASLAAILQLTSHWSNSTDLVRSTDLAPELLDRCGKFDWSQARQAVVDAETVIVLGRGFGLALAQEMALKLAEVCGIPALAYSAAQFEHGPISLVTKRTTALILSQSDATRPSLVLLARRLVSLGATVLQTGLDVTGTVRLESADPHPVLEPLLWAPVAYRLIVDIAAARGRDPDRPPLLTKITRTA